MSTAMFGRDEEGWRSAMSAFTLVGVVLLDDEGLGGAEVVLTMTGSGGAARAAWALRRATKKGRRRPIWASTADESRGAKGGGGG